MVYSTSFHRKFAQRLVENELEELATGEHILGYDNNTPVTWGALLGKVSETPSFFPITLKPPGPSPFSKNLTVAIVGGGVAGLRVAMMLETLDISYKLFEVSERCGGRAFTYHFKQENGEVSNQNYFDVGAMRFPDNAVNASLYNLFKELDITDKGGEGGKLIPYRLGHGNNILLFNGITKTAEEVSNNPRDDHFNDGEWVDEKYIKMQYQKLNRTTVYGVSACLEAAYGPFKDELVKDWNNGWNLLMEQDHYSTRSYMIRVMDYPWPVVQWMERSDSGTGGFDSNGFVESVLESLEFDYPTGVPEDGGKPLDIQWRCIEGGAETLTKAMYNSLKNKANIQTGKRVTNIAKLKLPVNYAIKPPVDHTVKPPADHTIEPPADPTFTLPFPATVMTVTVEDASTKFPFPPEFVPSPPFVHDLYSHVVSTVPLGCLRTVDLSHCGLDYKQEMALRSLHYSPAVKVGIKFKSRWWQDSEPGGSSKTDRQSRVVCYPSYGLDDATDTPGVLMATYNWRQDAFRYGSLTEAKDWSKVLDPDRKIPDSEKFLLRQIFTDLSKFHGKDPNWYQEQMVDYYAYDWYHNPFTMGAYATFGPSQFKNIYPSISKPASDGYLHFGGEAASYHHGWIGGALDSAWRCVYEILAKDGTEAQKKLFKEKYGERSEFDDPRIATAQYYRGIYANSLEKPGGNHGQFEF